jgi:hypothetical protein
LPATNDKLKVNISGVGVFFSQQDAGLLPAKPDSGSCPAFYCRLFNSSRQQNQTRCFAFLGGNSPLPIGSSGAIILL